MRPRTASFRMVLLAASGALLAAAPVRAQGRIMPDTSRFQQDVLVEGVFNEPTEIAVMHDGRVLIAERRGTLKLYDPRRQDARDIAGLPAMNSTDENGFIGLALDPGFEKNHWIYVNHSPAIGDRHRLSRFTLVGDSLRDERQMLDVRIDAGCCHTGGSIAFDRVGNLFVSYGDNSSPFMAGDFAPIDPTPGRELADALRSAGNTQDLRGKILRITPTADGKYTIPAGNLFVTPQEGRPEIYVMGNRNPYRISVDSHTGFLYWGEIGPDARADSTLGPRGYDEVNQARHAGNFGWPMFIADNQPYRNYNFTTKELFDFFDPAHPVNTSPHNTGARVLPPPQPAMIYYPYAATEKFPAVGDGGRAAMAGPVYHASDYARSRVKLPDYYDGKFIHYEWMRGWMMATTLDANGDYVRMEPMLSQLHFDHPCDVKMGPDGSLYVMEYGTYWFAKNKNARLSRITYHPDNRPPVARITATTTVGAAPLTTQLSADSSFDRDAGDSLRFTWSIPGMRDMEGSHLSHTFTTAGTHRVRLRVRDRAGAQSDAFVDVRVGNSPPTVALTVSGNRSFYWDDPFVNYTVDVSDAEDTRNGRRIDPRRLSVTLAYEPIGASVSVANASGHRSAPAAGGIEVFKQSDCLGCHATNQSSVGPAYKQVGLRYAKRPDATVYLMNKIASGGSGVWGSRVMPSHATLTPEVRRAMAEYILSLGAVHTSLPARGQVALDKHAAAPGGVYRLSASYADLPRHGIGSLSDSAVVLLRPSTVLARDAVDMRHIGLKTDKSADGTPRLLATVYEDSAFLALGRLDLTGIGRISFDLRSPRSLLAYSLELRSDGFSGPLLGHSDVTPTIADQWYSPSVPMSMTGEVALYLVVRSSAKGIGQFNPLVMIDGMRFERSAATRQPPPPT